MTRYQIILFTLLGFVFVFLVWGRWRYDIVAFCALLVALIAGVVPSEQAFAGFGHPATVIIALVLIVSRGLSNSGAVELVARYVVDSSRSVSAHIGVLAGVGAALSAMMNNVGALALLMPVDIQAAANAKRSPALTLMPLSFATILGGMVTLIGTPPNIIIASFRAEALGEPYHMFDFAPVGGVCAVVGVLFVMLIGWRLIPSDRAQHDSGKELFDLQDYIAEVHVPEGCPVIGKRVRELDEDAEEADGAIVGLIRRGTRLPGLARRTIIESGDILVVEAGPEAIEKLVGKLDLEYHRPSAEKRTFENTDLGLVEVVVAEGARIEKRSALSLKLLYRHGVTLLGVSRQGRKFRDRVRKLEIRAGDVLLLLGPSERLPEFVNWLGCLPLAERGLQLVQRDKAWLAVGTFALAIVLASLGRARPAGGPRPGRCVHGVVGHRAPAPALRFHRVARDRAAGIHDSHRRRPGSERRYVAHRRRHRRIVARILGDRGLGAPNGHHHDSVRRHEQHRDRRNCRPHRHRDRGSVERERRPFPHGGGGGRLGGLSDAYRAQEQYPYHGTRRLSLR